MLRRRSLGAEGQRRIDAAAAAAVVVVAAAAAAVDVAVGPEETGTDADGQVGRRHHVHRRAVGDVQQDAEEVAQ